VQSAFLVIRLFSDTFIYQLSNVKVMKKGQASNEVAMIIGFMTFFLVLLMGVVSQELSSASDERSRQAVDELADVIEAELLLAYNAENGYERRLTLPIQLEGNYSVSIFNTTATETNFSELILKSGIAGGYEIVKILPGGIVGGVEPGPNRIRKMNNVVNVTLT